MKFATKFTTEDELTNAISQFRTWYDIKQHGLTTKPRVENQETTAGTDDPTAEEPADCESDHRRVLQRVLAIVENIDSATLDDGDIELLAQIAKGIQRLKKAVVSLIKVAS